MPIPGVHACRLRSPADFQAGSFRTMTREHEGKDYRVIVGRLTGETAMTEQAFRYDAETWTLRSARAHCREHAGTFEPAAREEARTARAAAPADCRCGAAAPVSCDDLAALDGLAADGQRHRHVVAERPPAEAGPVPTPADDGPDLYLYGPIGGFFGVDAADVVARLRARRGRDVRVHLNSPGGNVFDGLAIYSALRQHDGPVEVWVDGLAASIASLIAMGSRHVVMSDAAMLMIHEPSALVIGTAHDMRHMARLLEQSAGVLADVYTRRSQQERAQVRQWMHDETWFTAAEAVTAGFADAVMTDPVPDAARAARAAFDLSAYRHPPVVSAAPPSTPRAVPRPARVREGVAHEAEVLTKLVAAMGGPRHG